jgi:hypothetical protein
VIPASRKTHFAKRMLIVRIWHDDEGFAGPHDNRLGQVHPTAFANGRRHQQPEALAGAGVDLEYRDTPHGLNAFEVKARNDPVIGETEGEVRVFVEQRHHAFFLNRIIVNFPCRSIALIAASRFNAELWLAWASWWTTLTGRRLRVYREAFPALCCWQRRLTSFVMPV